MLMERSFVAFVFLYLNEATVRGMIWYREHHQTLPVTVSIKMTVIWWPGTLTVWGACLHLSFQLSPHSSNLCSSLIILSLTPGIYIKGVEEKKSLDVTFWGGWGEGCAQDRFPSPRPLPYVQRQLLPSPSWGMSQNKAKLCWTNLKDYYAIWAHMLCMKHLFISLVPDKPPKCYLLVPLAHFFGGSQVGATTQLHNTNPHSCISGLKATP